MRGKLSPLVSCGMCVELVVLDLEFPLLFNNELFISYLYIYMYMYTYIYTYMYIYI